MASKLKKAAADAVSDWCRKNGCPAEAVRHVHPRAFVIGKAAPLCLVVSKPWQDSEPQCAELQHTELSWTMCLPSILPIMVTSEVKCD